MTLNDIAVLLVGVFVCFLIWMQLDSSPLKKAYWTFSANRGGDGERGGKNKKQLSPEGPIYTAADFMHQPEAVRRCVERTGYLGKPRKYIHLAGFGNAYYDLKEVKEKSDIYRISYLMVNFTEKPEHYFLSVAKHNYMPCHLLESYREGHGNIKRIFAKFDTQLDRTEEAMDKTGMTSFLSQCFLYPDSLSRDYISCREVDEHSVEAVFTDGGRSVSGIFTFDENGDAISFVTEDRSYFEKDNPAVNLKWTAKYCEYKQFTDGIRRPGRIIMEWTRDDIRISDTDIIVNEIR